MFPLELSMMKKRSVEDVLKRRIIPKDGVWDVIIIGSGPAGLTAAIYSARALLSTLIIAGYSWGGQLMIADIIENFPGFPEGIRGPELMERMKRQAEYFGANIIYEDASRVNFKKYPFSVFVGDKEYLGRSIIVATGAKHRKLGLESEERLLGKGVSYCAVCDGYFFRDKRVAVIGGGNVALTEALFLSNLASEVYLIHRRDGFRAEKILQERVKSNDKIKLVLSNVVVDILGESKVEGLKLLNKKSGQEWILTCEGVFIAIGYEPNSDLFRGQLEIAETGHIKVTEYVKTNIPGVFAAGDVVDSRYRQAITSAAMGAMAAIEAEEFIRKFSK